MSRLFSLALLIVLGAACSQPTRSEVSHGSRDGAGASEGVATGGGGAKARQPGAGRAIVVDGELGTCDPLGVWRGKGRFTGTGDCDDLPANLSFEVTVSGRPEGGYLLVGRGRDELVPDRLAARGGVCALGFRLRRAEQGGGIVHVHVHALASGLGSGVWQPMDGAQPRCSEGISFEISRVARSAE